MREKGEMTFDDDVRRAAKGNWEMLPRVSSVEDLSEKKS